MERRMMPKKTLTGRFVLVLCVTFLPLSLLTFGAACVIAWNSYQQMYDAYERSLDGELSPLEENLSEVDADLDSFVLDHLAELTSVSAQEEVLNYQMLRELGDIQAGEQTRGAVYLFDRRRSSLYLNYRYDTYSYEDVEDFRGKLLNRGFPQGTSRGWQLWYFDRKCYLIRTYEYAGYDIGFLVDMNCFVADMDITGELSVEDCYLADDTKVMQLSGNTCIRHPGGALEDFLQHQGRYRFLEWDSSRLGISMALQLPILSVAQRFLLYFVFLLLMFLLEVAFVLLFWRMIKKWVVIPIRTMNEALAAYGQEGRERYRITGIPEDTSMDFRRMFENFNEMAAQIEEGKRKERQLYDMTLDNLKLRMNPHMLMNSLNLIYSMAQMEDYHSIQEFTLCMTDYFRYILKETNDLATVREEMDFVKSYLGIQKIRFPNRFNCVYTMEEETEEALIPPLLIENFVENAVKYAMIPGRVTEILINIRRQDAWLFISVTDTGRGIQPEILSRIQGNRPYVDGMGRAHIGISNCRKWIAYYYQGRGKIHVTSKPGAGTQVWIEVPFTERERRNVR